MGRLLPHTLPPISCPYIGSLRLKKLTIVMPRWSTCLTSRLHANPNRNSSLQGPTSFDAMGMQHLVKFQPPVRTMSSQQLKAVSINGCSSWPPERSFTLSIRLRYLRSKAGIFVVLDTAGRCLAFHKLISVDRTEITGDLMLPAHGCPPMALMTTFW